MRISRLDHLVLTVKDINKTVDFYVDVLGMEKEIFKENRVALKFGKQKINLHQLVFFHKYQKSLKTPPLFYKKFVFIPQNSLRKLPRNPLQDFLEGLF